MILDIFTHILPGEYYQRMMTAAPGLADIGKRMAGVRGLHDLDARFRAMDPFGDYRQVISLPNPPLEEIADPATGAELARMANDAMAELVHSHPDRFPAFVGAVTLHNMDAALAEIERAVRDLGARGIQIFTNVAGRPLDDPAFAPIFAAMAACDLPLWLHPTRTASIADYAVEARSRYEIWNTLGWPYETSVAMMRLVLSGLFDRHPGIKIITPHLGGMIPFFANRIDSAIATLGTRTTDEDLRELTAGLSRPPAEYFKLFYGDTALFGGVPGTRCGIEYFGIDHVVFATDAPFGPIPDALAAIDTLDLDAADRGRLLCVNAERLMNTSFE